MQRTGPAVTPRRGAWSARASASLAGSSVSFSIEFCGVPWFHARGLRPVRCLGLPLATNCYRRFLLGFTYNAPDDRPRACEQLAGVLEPGVAIRLLCFSRGRSKSVDTSWQMHEVRGPPFALRL